MVIKEFKNCPICKNKGDYERTLNNIKLVKCCRCSFVYANLSPKQVINSNNNYRDKSDEYYQSSQGIVDELWFNRIAKSFTKKIKRGKVLDVGCGNGILLNQFINYGWEAYGVDISSWSKKYARRYGFKIYTKFIENANLPSNYFDLIISTSTLEHIPNPIKHIKETLRVLKPGGLAYFCGMPNYGSLAIKMKLSAFYHNTPPGHVNYFTNKSMSHLFNKLIFPQIKKIRIRTYGIPELYNIYKNIIKSQKKVIKKERNLKENTIQKPSKIKYLFYQIFISLNYHLGRILKLGDKLEILIQKK